MAFWRSDELDSEELQRTAEHTFVPRPVTVVSTMGAFGFPQLYPLSWYSSACPYPPVQYFSIVPEMGERGVQLLRDIERTGDFVLNAVDDQLAPSLPILGAERRGEESEFLQAGLRALPSVKVKSMRIAQSPAHMECVVLDIWRPLAGDDEVRTGKLEEGSAVVFGTVVQFHVDSRLYDEGKIDQVAYGPIGALPDDLLCRIGAPYTMQPELDGAKPEELV